MEICPSINLRLHHVTDSPANGDLHWYLSNMTILPSSTINKYNEETTIFVRKKMEVKERVRDFKERGRREWRRGKNPSPPLSFITVMLSSHRDSELQPRRYPVVVFGGLRKRKTERQTEELPSPPLSSASPLSLVAPLSSLLAVGT
ncbi:hypothetical protein PIB30_018940 [Stylosanthes scabra]|uniref:Uncharacterized protein n=1 Tax=Stylosanthes scabra TaxID=79078 RepID=A0ABU6Y6H9_9FABA|nr:hypothetical protein [Stylosanthes scabra]